MNLSKVISIPFRYSQLISNNASSFTASATETDLIPENFGTRLSDMAADYQKYRFVELKVSALTPLVPVTDSQKLTAVQPGVTLISFDPLPSSSTGAIGGMGPMSEHLRYALATHGQVASFHLSRRELIGRSAVKWFETTSTGSPPDLMRYQGTLYSSNVTPGGLEPGIVCIVTVQGTCEFSVPIDPSDAAALKRRDRKSVV